MTVQLKLSLNGQNRGSVVSSEIPLSTKDHGSIELVIYEEEARGNHTNSTADELQVRDRPKRPCIII